MNFPWFDIINFICFMLICFFAGRFVESEKKLKDSKEEQEESQEKKVLEMCHKIYTQILILQDIAKNKNNDD